MQDDQEYLEITFNTIDQGITIYDKDLCLVKWNEQYSKMGITAEHQLYKGSSLLESYITMAKEGVFGDGDPVELAQERIDALKSGPLIESEQLHAPSNKIIRINRFRLKNGGICATFRDVTEDRKIEKQLRQTAKHDALGRLTGGVAHDLNNVLAIIVGSLELAQLDPDQSDSLINNALDASERAAKLIRGLVAFSRQQSLKPTVVSVANTVQNLRRFLDPLIRDSVLLDITVDDNLWRTEIDINQFESMMMNLVINAKDAIVDSGRVSMEAKNCVINTKHAEQLSIEPGEYVCVSVNDTGTGMSAEVLENAIDPFFTTKPPEKGTGLGLSMAHGFARQSKGYLVIDSQEGVGSTVSVYLPKSTSEISHLENELKNLSLFDNVPVVIVEDDDTLRSSMDALVSSLGCQVTSFSSGKQALDLISWQSIELLITDIAMPEMSGTELADQATTANANLKVIYMSGYAEDSTIKNGNLNASSLFIQKPFRRQEISQNMLDLLQ